MRSFPKLFILHRETQKPAPIPLDEQEWPDEWKIVEFKEYPRMPKRPLPEPEPIRGVLDEILLRRRSRQSFDPRIPITAQTLSSLLYWSSGISIGRGEPSASRRFYPSGGASYPLEIYFYFRGNDMIPQGMYHYNVRHHCLERLPIEEPKPWINSLVTYPWVRDAALVLFITAVFGRATRKYRERGYRFGLLEAGALMQNFYLVTEALNLGCCAVGSPFDGKVEAALEIDGRDEAAVLALAIGPLKRE